VGAFASSLALPILEPGLESVHVSAFAASSAFPILESGQDSGLESAHVGAFALSSALPILESGQESGLESAHVGAFAATSALSIPSRSMTGLLLYRASLLAHEFSAPWFARSATIRGCQQEIEEPARFHAHTQDQRAFERSNTSLAMMREKPTNWPSSEFDIMPINATSPQDSEQP
jgi:hypothetical protein